MSRTDILTEIKKAEADAKAAIDAAEADKRTAIANARRDSVSNIQNAEVKMRASSESKIAKKKDELAAERDKLLKVGAAEAGALEKKTAGKMSDVKDFLNKEFERTLNVAS